MRISTKHLVAVLGVLTLCVVSAQAGITINFSYDPVASVDISGATSLKDVGLFIISWSDILPSDYLTKEGWILTADVNGDASYTFSDDHIPDATLVVAVDLANGDSDHKRPGEGHTYPQLPGEITFPRGRAEDVNLTKARSIIILHAHPDPGASATFNYRVIYDGSTHDLDPSPTILGIDTSQLKPIDQSPRGADVLATGDRIIFVEPYNFLVDSVTVE